MEYTIKRIKSKDEITQCEKFVISNYQWNSTQAPAAYGYMGYLEGEGFYVEMFCEESDPLRVYENPNDPVWKDSTMEAFLAFPEKGEMLTNDDMHINYEVNANGALYAGYGKGRKGRQFMPEKYWDVCDCRAKIEDGVWSVSFLMPEEYLINECGMEKPNPDMELYCNFYKISETKEIEHYGSFSRIENETPNFHLPVWFAKCRLEA